MMKFEPYKLLFWRFSNCLMFVEYFVPWSFYTHLHFTFCYQQDKSINVMNGTGMN